MFVLAFRPILLLIPLLFFSSCKINPTYDVTGVIIQKDTKNNVMLIDHDRIEGFISIDSKISKLSCVWEKNIKVYLIWILPVI